MKNGFWVSNDLIDKHFSVIKARGIALYCLLARCQVADHYPSVWELKDFLRCNAFRVEQLLDLLLDQGLLNEFDVSTIKNKTPDYMKDNT